VSGVDTCFHLGAVLGPDCPGDLQRAESEQLAGECFRHLARHRADDPNGDIGITPVKPDPSLGVRSDAMTALPARS
jgi:hypothetical protein